MSDKEVKLNSKHVNASIDYHLLSDEEMVAVGFRLVESDSGNRWYYYKRLHGDIPFNVTLPVPYDQDNLGIDILDEEFLQPYDYQRMIKEDPDFYYANKIFVLVEEQMSYLRNRGILSGHEKGDYI